jgi:hypothetical protein
MTYVIIGLISFLAMIVFLAVLGINIFVYMAKGTQNTANFVNSLFETYVEPYVGSFFSNIGKFFASIFIVGYNSALGGESAVDFSAGIVGAGLAAKQGLTESAAPVTETSSETSSSPPTPQQQEYMNEQQQQQQQQQATYIPSESKSTSGWCYVGQDQGYRSCLEINPNTTGCTSGQLYGSKQECLTR